MLCCAVLSLLSVAPLRYVLPDLLPQFRSQLTPLHSSATSHPSPFKNTGGSNIDESTSNVVFELTPLTAGVDNFATGSVNWNVSSGAPRANISRSAAGELGIDGSQKLSCHHILKVSKAFGSRVEAAAAINKPSSIKWDKARVVGGEPDYKGMLDVVYREDGQPCVLVGRREDQQWKQLPFSGSNLPYFDCLKPKATAGAGAGAGADGGSKAAGMPRIDSWASLPGSDLGDVEYGAGGRAKRKARPSARAAAAATSTAAIDAYLEGVEQGGDDDDDDESSRPRSRGAGSSASAASASASAAASASASAAASAAASASAAADGEGEIEAPDPPKAKAKAKAGKLSKRRAAADSDDDDDEAWEMEDEEGEDDGSDASTAGDDDDDEGNYRPPKKKGRVGGAGAGGGKARRVADSDSDF